MGLYWGVLVGFIAGCFRVLYFLLDESYAWWEIRRYGLYFVKYQVDSCVLWALAAAVVFVALWIISDAVEGLLLSASVTLAVMVPLAYYVNKRFLPGFRDIESLLGNALIGLVTLAAIGLIYGRATRNFRILHRLYTRFGFALLLVTIGGVNALYYSQPAYARLESRPGDPAARIFESLRFSTDGIDGLDRSLLETDRQAAEERLLDYFDYKVEAVRGDVLKRVGELYPDPQVVVSQADSIVKRSFTLWGVTRRLQDPIDWYENPTDDEVWLFALDEFEWMWELVAAYVVSGDEVYASNFARIMTDWLDQTSLADWKNEDDPVWRLIGVGLRLSGSWVDAFYVFLPSESVGTELKVRMLAAIHDQAQFLSHFRSPQRNHLVQESFGLLKAGVQFPEFKMASRWIDTAKRRLTKSVLKDVYPDGGYTEGSTFYHRYVVRLMEEILTFAESHGTAMPEVFSERLERMYNFMMYTAWPDGRMPAVNDGFHAKVLRPLFDVPARRYDRQDFEYFATGGKAGCVPEKTSTAFPYTGLYVMRSDWTENAAYMILDAGLFGSAHGHEDMLNFELYANGSPFIVEAGTYTYVYNDWHRYFESSFAHNTIVVDGKSQLRQPHPERWVSNPQRPMPNVWVSNDTFDYLEATYSDGYGNTKERVDKGVRHTRRVLFAKPDYWIVWDVVRGHGEHRLDQLFHFAPMALEISPHDKAVLTKNSNGPNLLIYPLFSHDLEAQKIFASKDPIQGWISPKYGELEPAPVVQYSRKTELPTVFLEVLKPLNEDQSADSVEIGAIPVSVHDSTAPEGTAIGVSIATPGWTDHVMLAPGVKGRKVFGSTESESELCIVRTDRQGKVVERSDSSLNGSTHRRP